MEEEENTLSGKETNILFLKIWTVHLIKIKVYFGKQREDSFSKLPASCYKKHQARLILSIYLIESVDIMLLLGGEFLS